MDADKFFNFAPYDVIVSELTKRLEGEVKYSDAENLQWLKAQVARIEQYDGGIMTWEESFEFYKALRQLRRKRHE